MQSCHNWDCVNYCTAFRAKGNFISDKLDSINYLFLHEFVWNFQQWANCTFKIYWRRIWNVILCFFFAFSKPLFLYPKFKITSECLFNLYKAYYYLVILYTKLSKAIMTSGLCGQLLKLTQSLDENKWLAHTISCKCFRIYLQQ